MSFIPFDSYTELDTCFCIVNDSKKIVHRRCTIHPNSNYREVVNHCAANQFTSTTDEDQRQEQKRTVRESTRP